MTSKLDIETIFNKDAKRIMFARDISFDIHHTKNTKSAGDEIEITTRNFFRRMLPAKCNIQQGHLIDSYGKTSPQLDIIVSDNNNLPSLFTTENNTTYIPIDSVYAVGEIKSTYNKQELDKYIKTITDIKDNLFHQEFKNTCFKGIEGKDDFNMSDLFYDTNIEIFNRIFYFLIFVDKGKLNIKSLIDIYQKYDAKYLPNITIMLNKGIIFRGYVNRDKGVIINKYPESRENELEKWYFAPLSHSEKGSSEGNHLAMLYYFLIEHVSKSHLHPPSFSNFISDVFKCKKDQIIELK